MWTWPETQLEGNPLCRGESLYLEKDLRNTDVFSCLNVSLGATLGTGWPSGMRTGWDTFLLILFQLKQFLSHWTSKAELEPFRLPFGPFLFFSSWELEGIGITQISGNLVCRQSWPQGQVSKLSLHPSCWVGKSTAGFSRQQRSVTSSRTGPRRSLSSNVSPVSPGEWFRAKVTVGLEPRWKDRGDHKTRSLVWWPAGKRREWVCVEVSDAIPLACSDGGGEGSAGMSPYKEALTTWSRGEGEPTVSHPGRDAVCPSPEERTCGFPTLSFYDFMRNMGWFSHSSCAALLSVFESILSPSPAPSLMCGDSKSICSWFLWFFFFIPKFDICWFQETQSITNCVCLGEGGLVALCQVWLFLDCICFSFLSSSKAGSYPGSESEEILGAPRIQLPLSWKATLVWALLRSGTAESSGECPCNQPATNPTLPCNKAALYLFCL